RAVKIARDAAKEYNNTVATLGELIHNPRVIADLKKIGVECKANVQEFADGSAIIIRSHGVGPDIYAQAQTKNLQIIDATCPHVLMAQKKAKELADAGYFVIIIGEKKHPEVQSIRAWAGENSLVIETTEDIANIPYKDSYGVVCQTTFEAEKFETILTALRNARSDASYRVEKTICTATANRQDAAKQLALEADAVIVLGGYKSANTRHLLEVVKEINPRAYHVESIEEVSPAMLENVNILGITAGASTPQEIIKEAMVNMETMESLLEEKESVQLHIGMVVEATVVAITGEEVVVDFGYQSEGAVAFDQWALGGTRETVVPEVNVGDKVILKVTGSENQDGLVVMSKIKAVADQAWTKIPELLETTKVLDVKGLKAVKGGLTVSVANVTGFIPASHLDLKRVENIRDYEGKDMQAEVLEFNPEKKRLVLSRREVLKRERLAASRAYREEKAAKIAERKEEEEKSLASLIEGSTIKGVVKSVVDFGLFVEVAPYLQGLVHVSELSWEKGVKPSELYKVGQEVEVYVKGIDAENARVSLSIKHLQEDPWQAAVSTIHEGDIITGKVVRFLPFGAIIHVNDKVEGMVHISEIAAERIEKPEDVLKLEEEVQVKVLNIDTKHKKVGLSIVKAKEDVESKEVAQYITTTPELSQELGEKLNSKEE
ncbi:MAG: 4-hydroxy-3-methylbut-2-enyl diphosphate reductase, partial [Acidaminococcaceae bacterium]|nr:4-hydroxy-3-methylbut-2-enyl diphosphate reductase [Acidaminococcaceae bacterium]